jgi:hypothetical protein
VTRPELGLHDDMVIALADLVSRCGATEFELGYVHDDVPAEEAGWYAHAMWSGTRITAEDHRSPTAAALALSERLLHDAACKCGRVVTLADGRPDRCRWRLVGQRWQPGCTAPPMKVHGKRGDTAALGAAVANRAERRKRGAP